MLRLATILGFLVSSAALAESGERHVPSIDELMSIKSIRGVAMSPDGSLIAYQIRETDFDADKYVSQIWLADIESGSAFQLTRGKNSASAPRWSPNGKWLTFTRGGENDKSQIFAIRPQGGEAFPLTKAKEGVGSYEWSPDGKSVAFVAGDSESDAQKARKKHLGDWVVVRRDYRHRHLWTFQVDEAMKEPAEGKRRTSGTDFNVGGFSWSPDSQKIAFSATINPDLVNMATSDVYVLTLDGDGVEKIVSQPGSDRSPRWSPDGRHIVFASVMGKTPWMSANTRLAVVSARGGPPRSITDTFDEDARLVEWNEDGIYFSGMQKTASHLFRTNIDSRTIERITGPDELMAASFSLSHDGKRVAFTAGSPTSLGELHVSYIDRFAPRALTTMTEQVKDYVLASREVISWTSRDDTVIEGVLLKPADFDPKKKHPLLCVIHGGPTGIDRPGLLTRGTRIYPMDVWTGRGALVLRINYRGSAGYGEAFRRLNVGNLGVGDAWDVLSGVDHLIEKGWVDPDKVGCMGWSQGGYISAFLTTASDRFVAISVGAGISNWATYYYNTDITPFTIDYLGDNPIDDPDIYRKTSPMSYIRKAKTPTLIQHGEFDRRVPIANAYELRQGLEDRGVPVELIVYKGFGHGISTPKAARAATRHNLAWFNHYIWGDPLGDFTKPDVPDIDKDDPSDDD